MNGQLRSTLWREYFSTVRGLALILAAPVLLVLVINLLRIPPSEALRRALVVAPLMVSAPFAAAAVMVAIPRLWFWPWMQSRKAGARVDPALAFATELMAADAEHARELRAKREAWNKAASNAPGRLTLFAAIALTISVLASITTQPGAVYSLWVYVASAIGCWVAILGFRRGGQREQAWRLANPFEVWRYKT